MPQVCLDLPHCATPAETCQSIYFVQLCKKYLTIGSLLYYNRRRAFTTQKSMHNCHQKVLDNPGLCAYNTRVGTGSKSTKTSALRKNFAHTRKKDLTSVAFARIMARVTPFESKLHFRTGAPAPKFAGAQAPAGVPRGTSWMGMILIW